MKPNVHLNQLPPRHTGPVAIDIEIFQARRGQIHRPYGQLACLSFCPDGRHVYLVTDPTQVEKAVARVAKATWVFHNANFDLRHLRRWAAVPPRNIWDTLIMERLLFSGWYDRFRLSDLSRRYLKQPLLKETRDEFIKGAELNDEMILYAATDAQVTWHIYRAQEKLTRKRSDALKVWTEIDQPALWAVLDFKGFRLDVKGWKALADKAADQKVELNAKWGFNLGSVPQVRENLHKRGIVLDSTAEDFLKEYEDDELAQDVLTYRAAGMSAGTYGNKIIEMLEDGYLWPNHEITEAATGRTTSDSPNMQNFPHTDEYRSKFIASKGHRIVGADYSLEEAWLATTMHKDTRMWAAFEKGEDVHSLVAQAIYKDPTIEKGDERRRIGKNMHFGTLYGQTAYGLAAKTELTLEEAEQMMGEFFAAYPGIEMWMEDSRRRAARLGYTETLGGRRRAVNLYNKRWVNNAINDPVQGSAADVMKVALGKLHAHYGEALPVVTETHDEIVMDVPTKEAKRHAETLERCMIEALLQIAPNGPQHKYVNTYIARSWAGKE